jgi:hypothetical protein
MIPTDAASFLESRVMLPAHADYSRSAGSLPLEPGYRSGLSEAVANRTKWRASSA